MLQDLPGLDQEGAPGWGELHMVGRAVQQQDAQLTFQPLQLLAQGRVDDVLPGGRPAEVQLLDKGDEVAQLAMFHAVPAPPSCPRHLNYRQSLNQPARSLGIRLEKFGYPIPAEFARCCLSGQMMS
jgi:hypothetical protein